MIVAPRLMLVFALVACTAAHGQTNTSCFNSSLPPTVRIDACSEVIDSDPRHAQAYQARAAAWSELRDYDEAIDDYTQAINIDPKYLQSFYGRGLAWERKGKLHNALDDFRYFVSVNPTPDALSAVTRVVSAQKKIEDAAVRIARAHVATPSVAVPPMPAEKPISTVLQGRRLALVMGNNAYENVPRLEKAVGDADAVAHH